MTAASLRCISLLLLLAALSFACAQHSLHQPNGRSAIAQMFEWRFDDIAHECEHHLGPKGYAAVQVNIWKTSSMNATTN